MTKIEFENGPIKTAIENDDCSTYLSTTRDGGHHWARQSISPEQAKQMIGALKSYLNGDLNEPL